MLRPATLCSDTTLSIGSPTSQVPGPDHPPCSTTLRPAMLCSDTTLSIDSPIHQVPETDQPPCSAMLRPAMLGSDTTLSTGSPTSQADSVGLLGHPTRISHPLPVLLYDATSSPAGRLLLTYEAVRESGMFNFAHAQIPLPQPLNIPLWEAELKDYSASYIVNFLNYGWPIGYTATQLPVPHAQNHHSALAYPDAVQKYITTEIQHGAMLGPFSAPPFDYCHISPLMTRPKKDSTDRRVIVDLSFPRGTSVNDGIPKEEYMGQCYKLQYPGVDSLTELVLKRGQGCLLYKVDLSRAYRHFRADVSNYFMFIIEWGGQYYIDTSIPFGLRTGALICQKVTNAFTYIMAKQGIDIVNYIDDLAGCAEPESA